MPLRTRASGKLLTLIRLGWFLNPVVGHFTLVEQVIQLLT